MIVKNVIVDFKGIFPVCSNIAYRKNTKKTVVELNLKSNSVNNYELHSR